MKPYIEIKFKETNTYALSLFLLSSLSLVSEFFKLLLYSIYGLFFVDFLLLQLFIQLFNTNEKKHKNDESNFNAESTHQV